VVASDVACDGGHGSSVGRIVESVRRKHDGVGRSASLARVVDVKAPRLGGDFETHGAPFAVDQEVAGGLVNVDVETTFTHAVIGEDVPPSG